MNKDESNRFQELCALIAVEQDRRKFMTLVEELNHLLSTKDQRLQERNSPAKDDKTNK
jgi:hypothetical protein